MHKCSANIDPRQFHKLLPKNKITYLLISIYHTSQHLLIIIIVLIAYRVISEHGILTLKLLKREDPRLRILHFHTSDTITLTTRMNNSLVVNLSLSNFQWMQCQIKELEDNTREQSQNPEWFHARKHCITGLNVNISVAAFCSQKSILWHC